MIRRRGVPLPAPTATELAAVRARLDGRRRGDAPKHVAAAWVTALAWGAGALVTDLTTSVSFAPWVGTVVALVLLPTSAGILADLTRQRDVDARVAWRLARAPGDGREDPWVATAARRGVRQFDRAGPAIVAGTACLLALLQVATLVSRPGPAPAVWSAGAVAVAAAWVGVAVRLVRAEPVGTGAVLRAADAAIRRRDARGAVKGSFVAVLLLVRPADSQTGVLCVLALSAVAALLMALSEATSLDEPLLEDPRLGEAESPQTWLAGVPERV